MTALLALATGVQQQTVIVNTDALQIVQQHQDRLDVSVGCGLPDRFNAYLVELPATARCGAFAAKHRPDIVNPGITALPYTGINQRPDDAGGTFGSQRKTTPAAVLEAVHFFLHHIGIIAETADEQLCTFEDRRAQFTVSVAGENPPGTVFNQLPFVHFREPDICCSGYCIEAGCHSFYTPSRR